MNTLYTCPMHPEVLKNEPGDCPKCGMALELAKISNEESANPEYINMRNRFILSLVLTIPLLIIVMGDMFPSKPISVFIGSEYKGLLEFILATPICTYAAFPFYTKFIASIKTGHLNMFTLIGLGVSVAYGYSLVALFLPDIFPSTFRLENGEVGLYFEAAGTIVTLILLGQVLELRARSQTGEAIKSLLDLSAQKATLVVNNNEEKLIDIDKVKVGDFLRVKPGEKVPLDGRISEGNSRINESMITGEAIPVSKSVNDKLIGATLNTTGSFIMQVEKIGKDTMLSRIIEMVSAAQRSRAPIQKLADSVSGYFVPIVIFISILTFIVWSIFGPEPSMAYALINAVAVLIIACPCALGLATPMSIMVATGRGAKMGVLFKNAQAIESLEKVNIFVIDKTGTITEGKPRLHSIITDKDEDRFLSIAASLERGREHPLALAVMNEAKNRKLELRPSQDFVSITGKGVQANFLNKLYLLGNDTLMQERNISTENFKATADVLKMQANTVIYLAEENELIGILAVNDPIKESAASAIKGLQDDGAKVVMLTGDSQDTANAVASVLNLDEVVAQVLPEQKADKVREYQEKGYVVAMAGDGINDAPALALADVGIAMGTGTDIAMQSADVTLIKGDLSAILRAKDLSRASMKNIKQNLFFAFIYNILGVPIAAGVLFPFFGILLSPIFAAAAMSFSSVSVITNALRLKGVKI